MALNQKFERGVKLSLPVASGVVSGDPVFIGHMTGVALNNRGAESTGNASVKFEGAFNLSVKGINENGNIAGVLGDPVFFVNADTPKLSLKSSGLLFGYLLTALASGATATVAVLLAKEPKSKLVVGLVVGGTAGNHTLTGTAPGDRLVFVGHITTAAAIATLGNLTSEFTISAANTLNNTGGTDTTNDQLLVIYEDRT